MKKTNALYNLPDQEQSHQQNSYAKRSQGHESGVVSRAFLVIALSLTLVGVLRWALNVTNANARQISNNLTRLQGHYDNQGQSGGFQNTGSFRNANTSSIRPSRDPIIEPEMH